MPRVLPANLIAMMGNRSGFAPANLLDIQTLSGTNYYWSDFAGLYPVRIGGAGSQQYKPWVKSCGPFKLSRSLATDGGTVIIQNISGAITRDLMNALNSDEFEGALCVYRWWHVAVEASIWQFQGYVTSAYADEEQGTIQLLQLFDLSQQDALDIYSEQCTWRYKEGRCGSVSAQAVCSKTFGDCQIRAAIERHNGMPFAPPSNIQIPLAPGSGQNAGAAGNGGGGDDGRGRNGRMSTV